jgi:hypothetical protein
LKHRAQRSPFKHLLKPKAGGVAFALEVLGDQFDAILNSTLVYDAKSSHICGSFLSGQLNKITATITLTPVSTDLLGNYQQDPVFREQFQQSINKIWTAKDSALAKADKSRYADPVIMDDKEIEIP